MSLHVAKVFIQQNRQTDRLHTHKPTLLHMRWGIISWISMCPWEPQNTGLKFQVSGGGVVVVGNIASGGNILCSNNFHHIIASLVPRPFARVWGYITPDLWTHLEHGVWRCAVGGFGVIGNRWIACLLFCTLGDFFFPSCTREALSR